MGAPIWSIMKAQALRDNTMGMYMSSRKTFELNPTNPIIEELRKRSSASSEDNTVKDLVLLLYDSSLLSSGFTLEEPVLFSNRIHRMIKLGLSLDDDDIPSSTILTNISLQPLVTDGKMEEVD